MATGQYFQWPAAFGRFDDERVWKVLHASDARAHVCVVGCESETLDIGPTSLVDLVPMLRVVDAPQETPMTIPDTETQLYAAGQRLVNQQDKWKEALVTTATNLQHGPTKGAFPQETLANLISDGVYDAVMEALDAVFPRSASTPKATAEAAPPAKAATPQAPLTFKGSNVVVVGKDGLGRYIATADGKKHRVKAPEHKAMTLLAVQRGAVVKGGNATLPTAAPPTPAPTPAPTPEATRASKAPPTVDKSQGNATISFGATVTTCNGPFGPKWVKVWGFGTHGTTGPWVSATVNGQTVRGPVEGKILTKLLTRWKDAEPRDLINETVHAAPPAAPAPAKTRASACATATAAAKKTLATALAPKGTVKKAARR